MVDICPVARKRQITACLGWRGVEGMQICTEQYQLKARQRWDQSSEQCHRGAAPWEIGDSAYRKTYVGRYKLLAP